MSVSEMILNFAESRSSFSLEELSAYLRDKETISASGILWHLKRLIKEDKIARICRGMYGNTIKKNFSPTVSTLQKDVYDKVSKAFPLIDLCVYSGAEISTMQHHLSANNTTYVEVSKEATEAVFHYLMDKGYKAYHKPSRELMTDYVNLSDECVIVKPLVTESPLMDIDGMKVPTLEKLLVDINCDADFYYLQGGETFYIMDYAHTMYNINVPKMLRYASRRGVRNKINEILNYQES